MVNASLRALHAKPYTTRNAGNQTMNFVPFMAAGLAILPSRVAPGVMNSIHMMTELFAGIVIHP
jgi:hypothetical protein